MQDEVWIITRDKMGGYHHKRGKVKMGTKGKRPAMLFYPRDWLVDPNLNSCSLCAQGLWIRMLCYMWESEKRGYLMVGNKALHTEQIVRLIGAGNPEDEVLHWLKELEDAGVYSVTDEGVIYSRRMVDDEGDTKTSKAKKVKKDSPRTRARAEDEDEDVNKKFKTKKAVEDALRNKKISYCSFAGFQKFWEIYPPRNGVRQNKKESFVSWVYLNLEDKSDTIMESVTKLKETEGWQKADGRYVPMAVTFLNNSRWEDEVEDYIPSAWTGPSLAS